MSRHTYHSKHLRRTTIVRLHNEAHRILWFNPNHSDLPIKKMIFRLIHALERSRQGGWCDKSIWTAPARQRTSDAYAWEAFNRLILVPSKCRTYRQWWNLSAKALQRRLLNSRDKHEILTYARNLKNIFGACPIKSRFVAWKFNHRRPQSVFREWSKIRRGRDLFLKGCGTFDLTRPTLYEMVDNGESPVRVAIAGYMLKARMDDLPGLSSLEAIYERHKEYFLKWFKELLDAARDYTSDEVLTGFDWGAAGEDGIAMTTEQLLELSPTELLAARRRRYRGTNPHSRLIDPDHNYAVTNYPQWNTDKGTLRPIDQYRDLVRVAEELSNCAASYHSVLANQRGKTALIVLEQEGKPIALGEWDGRWQQVVGPCNSKPEAEIQRVYVEYGQYLNKLENKGA